MRPRAVAATILLFAAALTLAWAFVVALSGGFAAGVLVARDPLRPLIVSAILAAAGRTLSPLDFDLALGRLVGSRERWPARAAAAAAAAVFVVSTAWNTRAAGGSDSSCYVLQAEAFAHGQARLWHPLAGAIPQPTPAMFAPAGFIPSRDRPGAAVPICAPGLALAMAAVVRAAVPAAVFLVVPASAALAVWLTFVFGRRAASDAAGAAGALLLACSPIFLYQAVQPMSDVPATALWLAALAATARGDSRGQVVGGVCGSLAVLTRPNLAIAILPLLALLRDRGAWVRWGLAAAPGIIAFAWLNQLRYGSPLATGYGETGALFSWAHMAANLARYPAWLIETESPLIVLALAAPWTVPRDRAGTRLAMVAFGSSALVVLTYLAYSVFDDWWYLRFLLPALPVLLVYGGAVLLGLVPPRRRSLAAAVLCMALGSWYLHVAKTRHVFELRTLESRYLMAGRFAARELPEDTVVIAGAQSGSIRYHGRRPTIAWEGVPPNRLDVVAAALRSQGRAVFIVLEDAETPAFRLRFGAEGLGRLDWPPVAELPAPGRVRFYRVP
jgi:hypothetical protein